MDGIKINIKKTNWIVYNRIELNWMELKDRNKIALIVLNLIKCNRNELNYN